MPRDLLEEDKPLTGDLLIDRQNIAKQPRDLLAGVKPPKKNLLTQGFTGEQLVDWAEAEPNPLMKNLKRVGVMAHLGGKEMITVPAHFFNQMLLNFPRSLANTFNIEYPEKAENKWVNLTAKGAGVAGLFTSPILNAISTLGKGAKIVEAPLRYKALAGAATGAAYAPTEDVVGLKERAGQAVAGGVLGAGVPLIAKGISKLPRSLPKVMNKEYVITRAKQAADLLDETRNTLGKAIGKAIDNVGDVNVNATQITQATKNIQLPQNILNALDNPMYGIEKLPDGSFKPTIKNIQKITEALNDFMTSKTWEEATKMGQRQVKQIYGVLKQAMKDAAPSIKEPISKYHFFMENYHLVNKTLRDSVGNVMEKPVMRALKKGGERGFQEAWENFIKFEPKAQQIMKDIQKFTQRQAMKKAIGRYAGYGLIGYGGFELGKKIIKGITQNE